MGTSTAANWGERRETVRINAQLLVRTYDQNHFSVCDGDISLGGARIYFNSKPRDTQVEVMFELDDGEVRMQGDIIHVGIVDGRYEARVRFVDWDLMDELQLARMLHNVSTTWDDWTQVV